MVMFGPDRSTVNILVSLVPMFVEPSVQFTCHVFTPSGIEFAVSVVLAPLVTEPLLA